MKYAVRIEEILAKTVIVEANSLDDAILFVEDKYYDGEIMLDLDNFSDTNIGVPEWFPDGSVPSDIDTTIYENYTIKENVE